MHEVKYSIHFSLHEVYTPQDSTKETGCAGFGGISSKIGEKLRGEGAFLHQKNAMKVYLYQLIYA